MRAEIIISATEFFKELRRLCDEHEMMFIVDEVQTGVGLTGKMWAYAAL